MRLSGKQAKRMISLALCLAMLISVVALAVTVNAADTGELTDTGADTTYYLWGENTNSPNFNGSTPTGTFTYDSSKGYYYCDLTGMRGDFCFVISTIADSAYQSVKNPAVQIVAGAGSYYLQMGNYHGYNCMHLYNGNGDDIRLRFASPTAGVTAEKVGGEVPPTQAQGSTEATISGDGGNYVYCRNSANWGAVYAYMWNGSGSDNNHAWPGEAMTDMGNGVWRYQFNKNYENIIFNIGSNATQTGDMQFPGAGYLYDNKTEQWTLYEVKPTGGTSPTTTQPTQSVQPTQPSTTSPTGKYVYCENEAGWSAVYAYMWNGTSDSNAAWPGVKMTNIGGNTWRYEVPRNFQKIIFNIGSNQTQTADMAYPGDGYCYNNKTKEWEVYDTSPLRVNTYVTDLPAPQYNGVGITVSASADGENGSAVYYKFSVRYNGNTTVLSDFSTKNSALWTPQIAGTYTLVYDFRDGKGNTNQRTREFKVEDGTTSEAPYIKTVTPAGGEIVKSTPVTVNVTAGGGITGTNLLFYKFVVRNAAGDIINVPYYSFTKNARFTPTATGAYTVTVSVQGSDNRVDERICSYNCVTSLSPTETPATESPTQPATQAAPTQPATQAAPTQPATQAPPVQGLKGDADDDGEVSIIDVTYIQRYDLSLPLPTPINLYNADVDNDDEVSILDATLVQRYNAGIIDKF